MATALSTPEAGQLEQLKQRRDQLAIERECAQLAAETAQLLRIGRRPGSVTLFRVDRVHFTGLRIGRRPGLVTLPPHSRGTI